MNENQTLDPAFSISLKNRKRSDVLNIEIFLPQHKIHYNKSKTKSEYYECKIRVEINRLTEERSAFGGNWLQALLMAMESVRNEISSDEEEDWQTDDGVPSWVILPKLIPIAWGYVFHKEAYDLVKAAERKINKEISDRYKI